MKRILYITANTKEEKKSSSKTVGRHIIDTLLRAEPGSELDELDLYSDPIPKLKSDYFVSRSALPDQRERAAFPENEQEIIGQIEALCDRFKRADITVLACPLWSMSFPSPVKEFLDCIILTGRTVEFRNNKPHGILDDRRRVFVYVQSSASPMPFFLRPVLNRGGAYLRAVMKFLGISSFYELPVDGTGTTETERLAAIRQANEKIPRLVARVLHS